MIPRYRLITFSPALSCPVPPHPFRSFIPSGSVTFRDIPSNSGPSYTSPRPFSITFRPTAFLSRQGSWRPIPSRPFHSVSVPVCLVCLSDCWWATVHRTQARKNADGDDDEEEDPEGTAWKRLAKWVGGGTGKPRSQWFATRVGMGVDSSSAPTAMAVGRRSRASLSSPPKTRSGNRRQRRSSLPEGARTCTRARAHTHNTHTDFRSIIDPLIPLGIIGSMRVA